MNEEGRKMPKVVAVSLVGTCQHCGEAIEIKVTKKQAKAIFKAFKASSVAEANLIIEKSIVFVPA